ncbi:endopeptidase La [bacterium]|nr:endopeptidase La [bacterium]
MAEFEQGQGGGQAFTPDGGDFPRELPIMPLKNVVVFPSVVLPIHVTREKSTAAIEAVLSGQRIMGLMSQRDEDEEDPDYDDLYEIGTIGLILRVLKLPEGGARILIQGLSRYKVTKWLAKDPYFLAQVEALPEMETDSMQAQALMRAVNEQFKQYVNLGKSLPSEILVAANNIKEPGKLADLVAANISIGDEMRQEILEVIDPLRRLERINQIVQSEIELLNMSNRIQSQVQEEVGRNQREYFLREQLKAIQKELGESDPKEQEQAEYRKKIDAANMPEEALKKANDELQRLERMHPESAEAGVIRTYLDTLCALPWSVGSDDEVSISKARAILDDDHYGLDEIKQRLLEFLGVHKLKDSVRGPILCLVGPPGVGKTSLGRSVAQAMGRKFVRMSLGGVRDEAEIRGHRRTYVGSMPGRIIQSIKSAGTNNPVIMLDEIDKLGHDFRGDPSSALLVALDPEQNYAFSDHYLEVPFDLSKVLFIATSNILDTIPAPLRDRMEVIRLAGYTELEKIRIVQKFILPKQLENHGLKSDALKLSPAMLRELTLRYTREAGLRNCEREVAKICRKVALQVAEGKVKKVSISTPEQLAEYLGTPRYSFEEARRKDQIGVVTGLVWTSAGGDTQVIEAAFMEGKGQLILTGQLGEVMQESCRAAMTYCRSNAGILGIKPELFSTRDVHLHFPAGAIPKDGPSAGITIAVALISLFTEEKVNAKVAMTGEISLKGRVLAIGGLKEKMLGAKRSGIHKILVPLSNRKDLADIPEEIKEGMEVAFVETIDEVLPHVFKSAQLRRAAALKAAQNSAGEGSLNGAGDGAPKAAAKSAAKAAPKAAAKTAAKAPARTPAKAPLKAAPVRKPSGGGAAGSGVSGSGTGANGAGRVQSGSGGRGRTTSVSSPRQTGPAASNGKAGKAAPAASSRSGSRPGTSGGRRGK